MIACTLLTLAAFRPLSTPHRVHVAPRTSTIRAADVDVDVAVIGGGPAGYTMAALLNGKHGHSVALVDPNPSAVWPNNYGEWRVEWDALSKRLEMPELLDCVNTEWKITDCYFGGPENWGERTRLDRAYVQVNRQALKNALTKKGEGVQVIASSLPSKTTSLNLFDAGLVHDASGSSLTLADGTSVRAKLVVDATGFESKLVARESDATAGLTKPLPPGYQIAYGFTCDIQGSTIGPYDTNAMTLFDYRTDHFVEGSKELEDAETRPSFMYVMPEGPVEGEDCVRAFFEETSLVGRDERRLEFNTLKERAMKRLKHLGMTIKDGSIQEEEYCYIPMGGNLPDLTQRVVAVGGAAATVHPSTGYQLCRMLAQSTDVCTALSSELKRGEAFNPEAASAAAYRALWPPSLRYQRDFQVFGGEFLGEQYVDRLRGFFSAFFQLEEPVWGGFLAGWPGLPGNEYHEAWNKRLAFGLSLFVRFPPVVALSMMIYAVTFTLEYGTNLLRSFATPLFGEEGNVRPYDYDAETRRLDGTYIAGDVAAKREALAMLKAGRGEPSPQVEMQEVLDGGGEKKAPEPEKEVASV